jgi:succinate dehydrogenase / fumarate reductase iron-sulfur subunit
MSGKTLKLRIWRQKNARETGKLVNYTVKDVRDDMSFLEMLDVLNEKLVTKGEEAIEFDYDCREGICGSCALAVNGVAHGPGIGKTTCQLYVRDFADGETITIEPFRAGAFPVIKDLVVDRSAFDRIMAAGGYVTVGTGAAPDANEIPIPKPVADQAFDAAACIGCGACVAQCKNASASLFVSAKVSQYALLPQGQAERERRVVRMVRQMEEEGFGACSNEGECWAVCPKEIHVNHIQRLYREYARAVLKGVEG